MEKEKEKEEEKDRNKGKGKENNRKRKENNRKGKLGCRWMSKLVHFPFLWRELLKYLVRTVSFDLHHEQLGNLVRLLPT